MKRLMFEQTQSLAEGYVTVKRNVSSVSSSYSSKADINSVPPHKKVTCNGASCDEFL